MVLVYVTLLALSIPTVPAKKTIIFKLILVIIQGPTLTIEEYAIALTSPKALSFSENNFLNSKPIPAIFIHLIFYIFLYIY